MAQRTVIDLSQTPIIKSLVERSSDDRVRLAGVESVQALTYSEVITRLDLILERLGIDPPPDPDPDPSPQLQELTLSTTEATTGQPYTATIAGLYVGTDYIQRVQNDRDGLTVTGTTLSGTFATVVPDITITETLYAKTAERVTVTVQAGPTRVTVTGPAAIAEGTSAGAPASVAATGPATIIEGTPTATPASVAVTGASNIVEGN